MDPITMMGILYAGNKLLSGFNAEANRGAIGEAKAGVREMFNEQVGLSKQQRQLGLKKAGNTFLSGTDTLNLNTKGQYGNIQSTADAWNVKSNMYNVGGINTKLDNIKKSMYEGYGLGRRNLFDTYTSAIGSANLGYEQNILSAERKRDEMLMQLEAMPDNFLKGVLTG